MTTRIANLLFALLLAGSCRAFEPQASTVPEKPWFPFPELPAVLWYDDFESGLTPAGMGKIGTSPDDPNAKSWLMDSVQFANMTKLCATSTLNFGASRLKVPNGLKTHLILFQFNLWAEEEGDLQLNFVTLREGTAIRAGHVPAKKWTPIQVRLNGVPKLEATDVIREVQVVFIPNLGRDKQTVYLDELLFLNGTAKPAEIMPLLQAVIKRRKEMERSAGRDGFTFRVDHVDDIRTVLRSNAGTRRRAAKSILVLPPRAEDSAAWVAALQKLAPEAKLSGCTFVPAQAPDGSPAGGLEDVRTLMQSILEKSPSEYVLMVLSYADVQNSPAPADVVEVVVERAIAAGSVPMVVLPPLLSSVPGDRGKLEAFIKSVTAMGAKKSIIVVDASSLLKAEDLQAKGNFSPQGIEALARIGLNGIRCLETHLFNRR